MSVDIACVLAGDAVRVWHEGSDDRLKRALTQQGITKFQAQDALAETGDAIILVRPDIVIDAPALRALIDSSGVVLLHFENG